MGIQSATPRKLTVIQKTVFLFLGTVMMAAGCILAVILVLAFQ